MHWLEQEWKKDEGFVQLFYSRIIYSSNEILFVRIVSYEVNYPMTIKRDKSQCHGNTNVPRISVEV